MKQKAAIPPPVIRTQIFNLNHVEATAIMEIVQEMLSPEGKVKTFLRQKEVLPPMQISFGREQSGGGQSGGSSLSGGTTAKVGSKWSDTLIITDVDSVLADISDLIGKLDTKPPQVKIEARLVEASSNIMDELGINWQAVHSPSGSTGRSDFVYGQAEGVSFNLGMFTASQFEDILFRIEALETNGEANTMLNPSVMTMDNEAAQMLVADRIPVLRIVETELRSTTSVEFINVGVSLNVIPHITEDGYIIMDVTPQADYIKEWRGDNPVISTRMANSRVRVKDGETFAISGLIKEEDKKSKSGIPILSRIPLLGRLFGSSNDSNDKTDLMVFVTPTIQTEEP
jgi:general secretion pathway protein D